MIFDYWYNKGVEAGYNKRATEDQTEHNRRLEDMFKRGKEIGWNNGFQDGYKVGYSEGEQDEKARSGEIDLDEVMKEIQEIEEEYKGFKGLVNERGFVDDEVVEATV